MNALQERLAPLPLAVLRTPIAVLPESNTPSKLPLAFVPNPIAVLKAELPLALAARVDKRPKEEAAGGRAGPMEKALGRGCVLRSSALTAEANGPA